MSQLISGWHFQLFGETKYDEVKKEIIKMSYVHKILSTWKRYKFQFTNSSRDW